MATSPELLARIKDADNLLSQDLPAGDRAKVAKLRLIDQLRMNLRQRRPDFDSRKGPKEPPPPIKEPPPT